jgi:hypothetical protein
MSELTTPPLEGKAIEPQGMRVRDLIEKLLTLDPELFVVTSDCCYGKAVDVEVWVEKIEDYENYLKAQLALKEGDEYVVIS